MREFRAVAGGNGNDSISEPRLAPSISTSALRARTIHVNEQVEQKARKIAMALHDEAGQILAMVHLKLEEISHRLEPAQREPVRSLRSMLDGVEHQLRRLAHELRPAILDDLGLMPAVRFLTQGVQERTGLSIAVEGSLPVRLAGIIETALYRIIQEALKNIAGDTKAKIVRISLRVTSDSVRCSISDDGKWGTVTSQARQSAGDVGLLGIEQRVDSLGGTLHIESGPGGGTELLVVLPLA